MPRRADRTTPQGGASATVRRRIVPGTGSEETAVILDYMAHARRKASRNTDADPLVAEIVETLLALGGSAHRDRVLELISSSRTGAGEKPSEGLRMQMQAAFDRQLAMDRQLRGRPPLFELPFGDGSHRWALAREAQAFLRRARKPLAPVS